MQTQSLDVPITDAALHCETAGDGEPILFVHGFPLDGTMWQTTVQQLVAGAEVGNPKSPHGVRYKCIVPDLRGFGRSSVSPIVTIARLSDDLAELLGALDEKRPVVLVGLSMGGIIAFDFFRRHRARLRALVLICTRANAESPEGVTRREALAQAVLKDGSKAAADAMIGNVFAPSTPAVVRQHWHGVMSSMSSLGVAATSRALAQRDDSFPTLPKIDVPTLVVAGEQDAITPVEGLRQIHEAIRGSQFEMIASAGHVPPIEQADAFTRVLGAFLQGKAESSARRVLR